MSNSQRGSLTDAERSFRQGLAIAERHGNGDAIAKSATALAIIAADGSHGREAEGWLRYVLNVRDIPKSRESAALANLARLIFEEVNAGRAEPGRLSEARGMARRAIRLQRELGGASEPWMTLNTLSRIAQRRGRDELAAAYRRCELDAYASFDANQARVDPTFGQFAGYVAASVGQPELRPMLLEQLPTPLAESLGRLWNGERDWYALVGDLALEFALVFRRVLDILARADQLRRDDVRSPSAAEASDAVELGAS
jgi:hypothetical protein